MNYKTEEVKKFFAKEFYRCCFERYPNFPSNEKLSRDLYVSSKYSLKISRETIRKWLKGETFPDLDCLLHLIDWLGLNMSNVFIYSCVVVKSKNNDSEKNHLSTNLSIDLTTEQIDLIICTLNSIKKSIK
jgi:hypothetical protein